jgi:hypothetical protein
LKVGYIKVTCAPQLEVESQQLLSQMSQPMTLYFQVVEHLLQHQLQMKETKIVTKQCEHKHLFYNQENIPLFYNCVYPKGHKATSIKA